MASKCPFCLGLNALTASHDWWFPAILQEDYPRLRPLCYPFTHVFILCFDIGNQRTLDCIPEEWIPEVRNVCPDTPIVLMGCKKGERKLNSWWRHQMETFSAFLAICAGNSPVTGEFPAQRPVTRSFDVFFDLRMDKLLSKQWWGWWFETPSHPSWRHFHFNP